jgi:hypothetical protein
MRVNTAALYWTMMPTTRRSISYYRNAPRASETICLQAPVCHTLELQGKARHVLGPRLLAGC